MKCLKVERNAFVTKLLNYGKNYPYLNPQWKMFQLYIFRIEKFVKKALSNPDFMVNSKVEPKKYILTL